MQLWRTVANTGPEIQVELPPELEAGVYANFALVQSGAHEFTLDLAQLDPPREEGDPARARVVARIRFAPTFLGPLLQAISQNAFNRDQQLKEAQQKQDGGDDEL